MTRVMEKKEADTSRTSTCYTLVTAMVSPHQNRAHLDPGAVFAVARINFFINEGFDTGHVVANDIERHTQGTPIEFSL